ncbi:MAG: hypothetical protein ACXADW_06740 [Candidatus Hodarchaeales archaeon]|jgi:uncharacterized membrane protein
MKAVKRFINGFKSGFEEFGQNIGIIINTALLLLVYFVSVGFTFTLAKLMRKKFLETELKNDDTYWVDLNLDVETIEDFYRQF